MSTVDQNALNSFTRGGQFLNNFVVMAKQNILRILVVVSVVGLVVGFTNWFRIADNHDRYVMSNEVIMRTALLFNPETVKEIRVMTRGGDWTTTTIPDRLYVGHYAADVATMSGKFKRAAFWGSLVGFLAAFLVFWLSARIGRGLGRDKHVRGAMLRKPNKVRNAITIYNGREAKVQNLPNYRPYEIAGVPYPFRAETQHTMTVGSTGSGKTQGISEILTQIYDRGDRGIVYDKMRSFVPKFYDPDRDIILNPLDARCPAWDMFGDARTIIDFENFAEALLPSSDSEYTYFEETARTVFAHTAYRVKRRCRERGLRPSIQTLLYMLTNSTDDALHTFLSGSPAELHIDPDNARTTGSIRSTLGNAIRSLGYLRDPAPTESTFSIRSWIEDDDRASVVYLTSRDDLHPVLKPIITMWLGLFTTALMSQPRSSSRSIWFIIDELPSLNRLPNLERALAEARQYGACYLIGIQLLSQLRSIYGHDGADTILGLTRSKLIFNPGDPITAETMAAFVGKQEINRKDHSMSIGATELRDGQSVANRIIQELIVMPEELSQLPSLTAILSFTGNFPVCRVTIEYMELNGREPGYLEDGYAIKRAEDNYFRGTCMTASSTLRGKASSPKAPSSMVANESLTLPAGLIGPESGEGFHTPLNEIPSSSYLDRKLPPEGQGLNFLEASTNASSESIEEQSSAPMEDMATVRSVRDVVPIEHVGALDEVSDPTDDPPEPVEKETMGGVATGLPASDAQGDSATEASANGFVSELPDPESILAQQRRVGRLLSEDERAEERRRRQQEELRNREAMLDPDVQPAQPIKHHDNVPDHFAGH